MNDCFRLDQYGRAFLSHARVLSRLLFVYGSVNAWSRTALLSRVLRWSQLCTEENHANIAAEKCTLCIELQFPISTSGHTRTLD